MGASTCVGVSTGAMNIFSRTINAFIECSLSLEPFWYPMETDQQGDTHTQMTGLSRSTLTTGMLIRPQQSVGAPNGRVHQGYEYHYRGDGGLTHTHTNDRTFTQHADHRHAN